MNKGPNKKFLRDGSTSELCNNILKFLNVVFLGYFFYKFFFDQSIFHLHHDKPLTPATVPAQSKLDTTSQFTYDQSHKDSTAEPTSSLDSKIQTLSTKFTEPSKVNTISIEDLPCDDPVWCNINMITKSYYKFKPPTDPIKWRKAQIVAASGEPLLLKKIQKIFTDPYDFLDGDRTFRSIHHMIDVFVDTKQGMDALTPEYFMSEESRRRLEDEGEESVDTGPTKQVVPEPYNYRLHHVRSPIVQLGYMSFDKDLNAFFTGNHHGGSFIKRNEFIDKWRDIKDKIDIPFIAVCTLNENWGMLSTNFPNRTAGWGNCCDRPNDRGIHELLDHDKTLMLVINQHSNITHPKILTMPRGLPTQWARTKQFLWDSIQYSVDHIKKKKLLFASTSSWGKRPQMIRCISEKMSPDDFEGHDATPKSEMKKTKTDRRRYYEKLASTMFGLSLPGLGYDTFRMWELLSMGAIVVVERGVGFDRSLWRLPAMLLDDFDEVNPQMLREAYIEAMYRADDFEFERLKQSFWWGVIYNVSNSRSLTPMLEKFPMEAVDINFARPKEPYECGKTGTCGRGTKRIPKSSC